MGVGTAAPFRLMLGFAPRSVQFRIHEEPHGTLELLPIAEQHHHISVLHAEISSWVRLGHTAARQSDV